MTIAFDGQLALYENSVSRCIRNLLAALVAEDSATEYVLLVTSHRSPEAIRSDHPWVPEGVRIVTMPQPENPYVSTRLSRLYKQVVLWPRALRRAQATIFHGQYNALPSGAGCRVVSNVHDVFEWVPHLGRSQRGDRKLRLLLERSRYRRADCLIADSRCTRADFLRYVDPARQHVEVIYNGVEASFHPRASPADRDVLSDLGIGDGPYLLYLGDLNPRKDVPTLLRAFAQARHGLHPRHQLVIGGSKGPGRKVEQQLCEELELGDAVRFLGRVPEAALPALYRGARLFVFPSLYEGFGLPPLEAMACGAPVAVSNTSALPEVVGETGMLFSPGDAPALADLLVELLADPERLAEMSARGIERARSFTWTRSARSVLGVYRRLAGSRSLKA